MKMKKKNKTCRNTAKEVLRRKFVAPNAYSTKEKRSQNNHFHY